MFAHVTFPAPDWAAAHGGRYIDFEALLAASDVVSVHAPQTPQTWHLLTEQTLARTKRGVFIVNTSRGKFFDTGALIARPPTRNGRSIAFLAEGTLLT